MSEPHTRPHACKFACGAHEGPPFFVRRSACLSAQVRTGTRGLYVAVASLDFAANFLALSIQFRNAASQSANVKPLAGDSFRCAL